MFQVDPWEKAADCERALRLTLDPVHRENLANIREFWISLANARLKLLDDFTLTYEPAPLQAASPISRSRSRTIRRRLFFYDRS